MAKRRRKPAKRPHTGAPLPPTASGAAPARRGRPGESQLKVYASDGLVPWLRENNISIGFTTYQTCRLFLLGVSEDGERVSLFERIFDQAMGLHATRETLHLATKFQVWRLEDILLDGERHPRGFDAQYVPRLGYTTGNIDAHDLTVDRDGRVLVISTLYSALAEVGGRYGVKPIWRPPFVSAYVPQDRCHLNGLAMKNGAPSHVTACGETDDTEAWRKGRTGGGVVVDVATNEIACRGFSMPHSPRWNGDKLWVLNSGAGELGHVDLDAGAFVPVTFAPGYLRGLAFHGPWAIVGLSKCRENRTFQGLPLDGALSERDQEAQCGLWIVDTRTGEAVHWLRIEGPVIELYDVQVIPDLQRGTITGFLTDEVQRTLTLEGENGDRLRLDRGSAESS